MSRSMRDWIGTAISLIGFALVVVTVVQIVRARGRRPARDGQSARARQHSLLGLCAGLATVEAGQLIRADSWLWTIMHLVVIGIVAAASLFIYRDLRRIPGRP
jgi:hypothetical protein